VRDAARVHADRLVFWEHVAGFAMLNALFAYAKASFWPSAPWSPWLAGAWLLLLALHGLWAYGLLAPRRAR
jgi:hypothetical protein